MSILVFLLGGTAVDDVVRFILPPGTTIRMVIRRMIDDGGMWHGDIFIPWHRVVRVQEEAST